MADLTLEDRIIFHDAIETMEVDFRNMTFRNAEDVDAFYEDMSGRQFVETMARLCGFDRREARRLTEASLDLVQTSEEADAKEAY